MAIALVFCCKALYTAVSVNSHIGVKLVSTESENVDKGTDYEAEISKIVNDRDGPYWNKGHPDHDKVVQQVFTMRTMLNG